MPQKPPKPTVPSPDVSPLQLNRISIYLRCLNRLQEEGVEQVSSKVLAARFNLSAPLIRKDLAQFGELGIRGHGYDVGKLIDRFVELFGLDREQKVIVVGMGKLGSALADHFDGSHGAFRVVAGLDTDPEKIGSSIGLLVVQPIQDIETVVKQTGAEIGLLTVPRASAQDSFERMVAAGIRSVLNFAPVRLDADPSIHLRNVDLRIHLEELAFFAQSDRQE